MVHLVAPGGDEDRPYQFSNVFERYGLPEAVVNSTCSLDGKLYIGTDTGLCVVDDKSVVSSMPLSSARTASGKDLGQKDLVSMLTDVRIRSIMRDDQNRLWFATYGDYGLIRYEDGKVTCFTNADGLPSDRVRTTFQKSDGTMLVACTGGLACIDGDRVVEVLGEDDGLHNTEILTVAEADNGDIVVGSDGGGIFVVQGKRGSRSVSSVDTKSGLRSDVVMRIKKDPSRDLFWIVTSNSLAYMDANYHVTTINNFPYSNNFDLYENKASEMWVLSSNGIHVVTVDELLKNGSITPVYYGRDNGLPCIATANSFSELTPDGDLYLAGTTGVAKVNIDVPFESVDDIKMAVPFVEADGEMLYPDAEGTIYVPASVSKLTIHPFVFTYALLNPQVSYSLEGFDQGETSVRRSELAPIDYTNLVGGTYHFNMQIHDAMGHGNKEMSVRIVKRKAPIETWWFRILSLAVLALVVFLITRWIYRRKTKALLKKEQEDRLFIREMTQAFAKVIDMKDKYTNGHSTRVADYTAMLTRELGYDDDMVERYYNIALLHDIGKIGVPAEVLNKPGKLTDHEFNIIKSHSSLGYRTLKDISIMPELAIGAGAHHERPDGKGYPRGLTGDEIPRVAQIIAVADTFDAMYSDRPYRKRMNFDKAVSIIREVRGTQLTEDVVDAFLRLVDKGEFRDPNDTGGGTTEDIDNIRKNQK
ncbi:MAG: HD domain-containing protein [Coriobacteriales bacterium]|nr:HD domain-containing protein [Coriobacteriales bacterium]